MSVGIVAGVFPRLAVLTLWIARPERIDAAFDPFLWPLLGIIFLPFATMIHLLLYTPGPHPAGIPPRPTGVGVKVVLLGRRRRPTGPARGQLAACGRSTSTPGSGRMVPVTRIGRSALRAAAPAGEAAAVRSDQHL